MAAGFSFPCVEGEHSLQRFLQRFQQRFSFVPDTHCIVGQPVHNPELTGLFEKLSRDVCAGRLSEEEAILCFVGTGVVSA